VDVHDRVEEITEEYDAFLEGKSLLDNVNPGKLKEQRSLRKDAERAEEVWLDFTSYFEEEFGEEFEEVTEEAEQWVEDSVPSMAA
jgi:broad specificity phosphatase PhoE